MAIEAYVFIECEHARAREVMEHVSRIAGVKEVNMVTGPYDLIARVAASNFKVLGEVVMTKIQSEKNIKRTLTNVIIE